MILTFEVDENQGACGRVTLKPDPISKHPDSRHKKPDTPSEMRHSARWHLALNTQDAKRAAAVSVGVGVCIVARSCPAPPVSLVFGPDIGSTATFVAEDVSITATLVAET